MVAHYSTEYRSRQETTGGNIPPGRAISRSGDLVYSDQIRSGVGAPGQTGLMGADLPDQGGTTDTHRRQGWGTHRHGTLSARPVRHRLSASAQRSTGAGGYEARRAAGPALHLPSTRLPDPRRTRSAGAVLPRRLPRRGGTPRT